MRLCSICGDEATDRCRICGRYVCAKHYVAERGVCSYCYMSLCELCNNSLAIASCPICGRLICEECSVELTKAVRVCKACYSKLSESENRKWPPRLLLEREKGRLKKIRNLTLTVLRIDPS